MREDSSRKMRTAVVGCGAISDIYLKNMTEAFHNLEVAACCAGHLDHALAKAEKYGIRGCTYEEILGDDSIELVVVLTPAPTHYELIRKALEAGKHVYTEKTMTIDPASAKELLLLAKEKGLYLCSAPDTFLGASLQTARKAVDEGMIGDVTSFQINANRDIEFLAGIFKFLRMPGGGICYDYGVYYLTALISLLGPVHRVSGIVKNYSKIRKNKCPDSPEFGEEYIYDNESQVTAVLELENGVTGNFCLNGDTVIGDLADFKIFGTKGALVLGDPNQFGGDVTFIPNYAGPGPEGEKRVLQPVSVYTENSRGVGPSEMARAVRSGKKSRTDAEMAYHVLEVISRIMESNESGAFEKVTSTCVRPEAFTDGEALLEK